jgi:hypothetical protein
MRAASLIGMLALASLNAAAREGITNQNGVYQVALAHIARIDGPGRSSVIGIHADSGFQPREQRVNVRGQISIPAVTELVHLLLASNRRYRLDTREWAVEVVGDSKFASVRADNQCRDFCGYVVTGAYSFDRGKWTLIKAQVLVE